MILLPAVLAGIVIALVRGGSLTNLAALKFRLGLLAILCLAAQAYVIYSPLDRLEAERSLHGALLLGSSALLLVVVWVNRRLPAMPLIGLGLLLNLAVMSANGGFMPVSRDTTVAAGQHFDQDAVPAGARVPRSKDVLLPVENTRLAPLSDTVVIPAPISRVCSIGDIVVAVGVLFLLDGVMVPAGRKRMKERSTSSPA